MEDSSHEHQAHRQRIREANNPLCRPLLPAPGSPLPEVVEGREGERAVQRPRVEVRPAELLGDAAGRRALAGCRRAVDRDYVKHRFRSRKKLG